MRKQKRKLDLDRVVVKPVDVKSLEQVTGGGKPPDNHGTPTSITPSTRNCSGCW